MPTSDPYAAAFAAVPTPCLLLDPQLRIVDANDAYLRLVGRARAELAGVPLLEAFPPDPEHPRGISEVAASMREALATGRPSPLPLLRYDLPGDDGPDQRWWTQVNAPVVDERGVVLGVLNVVEDVTAVVRAQESDRVARHEADALRARTETLQVDLRSRSDELATTAEAEARASRRLTALAEAVIELAGAETVEELTEAVVGRVLSVLGADGGAVAVLDEQAGTLALRLTASLGADAQTEFGELPLSGALPASVAARTGRPVLLPDRAAGLAFAPEMAEVYATAGKQAWASFPLRAGARLLGSVTASWDSAQTFGRADVELMGAFAAQCSQALHRLLLRQAERDASAARQRMSEALQRSLLTDPPQPDHLQLAVRYQPAAREAQVGGDWYDAFLLDGVTSLVVGDVAGHDRDAAVVMAQIRNVLRGVAHALGEPPAAVLTGLDRALADLGLGALATAVLAQVEQTPADAARGLRTLRWSSAGHPPPVFVEADGTARLLTSPPDLLLGLDPGTARADHTVALRPGTTVLLYTDGLVERRGAPLDDGLEWLRDTCARLAPLPLEDLLDALLAELAGGVDDDVALLAVRAHPEDRPRPPDARPRP